MTSADHIHVLYFQETEEWFSYCNCSYAVESHANMQTCPPRLPFPSVCMVAESVPEALNSTKNGLKIYTWESRRWVNGQGREFCWTVAQLKPQLILLQRSKVTQTLNISIEKVIFFIPALTPVLMKCLLMSGTKTWAWWDVTTKRTKWSQLPLQWRWVIPACWY